MNHNLTDNQIDALEWIVAQIRAGVLDEEFSVYWTYDGGTIPGYQGDGESVPEFTQGLLNALAHEGAIRCTPEMRATISGQPSEASRSCVLTKRGFDIADSGGTSPDRLWGTITEMVPKASSRILGWIAGIASAVIAGLILYYLTQTGK